MWFKNLYLLRLPAAWDMTAARLEERLARHPLQPCGGLDRQSRGWISPRGDENLVHAAGQQMLIMLGVEQKLLPTAVVNQAAQERLRAIEAQQGYRPGRKQARDIKQQVADELLPRAFSSRRGTSVWLDAVHGWLAVDAASAARAEEALGLLRDCLDDLPAAPLRTQTSPLAAMTSWLAAGEAPAGFSIDRDAVLQSPNEEKSTVRYARHPLEGEEIRRHIANGKVVTRLSLTWNDRVSFQLTDTLHVKQLAFLDLVKEEAESQAETADEQFDADFAIMTGELAPFLADLTQALGGEETNP